MSYYEISFKISKYLRENVILFTVKIVVTSFRLTSSGIRLLLAYRQYFYSASVSIVLWTHKRSHLLSPAVLYDYLTYVKSSLELTAHKVVTQMSIV